MKNITIVSSAESAQSVVKVKETFYYIFRDMLWTKAWIDGICNMYKRGGKFLITHDTI